MFRVKQRADMGESTSQQRIQLEEMVLKDKDDGKEIKTDNGLHARLLHLPVSFSLLPLALKNSYKNRMQVTVAVRLRILYSLLVSSLFFH